MRADPYRRDVEGTTVFTAQTTLPMLEPAPRDVVIVSLGTPAVLALVLLALVVVCARWMQRTRHAHRGLHVAHRGTPRSTVSRAA
jgi:hypothetical protein